MKVSFSQLRPSRKRNQFSPEPSGSGGNRNSGFNLHIWTTTSALCWVSSPFIHSADLNISTTVSVPREQHSLLFMSPRRILIPLLWFDRVPRSSRAGNVTHALAVPGGEGIIKTGFKRPGEWGPIQCVWLKEEERVPLNLFPLL